jgi:hypothetical protein
LSCAPRVSFLPTEQRSLPCPHLSLYGTLTEQSLGLNLAIDASAFGLSTDESTAVKNKFDREVKPRFTVYQSSFAPHKSHSYLLSNGPCRAQVCLGLYGTLTEQSLGLNLTIDFSASGLSTDESTAVKKKFDLEVKPRFTNLL